MKGNYNRIVRVERFDDPVNGLLVVKLRNERPEHLVPNDENPREIGIQISGIGRVVYTVMTWRVEHGFKPVWHLVDGFGVDPELVQQIQSAYEEYDIGMKSDHDHREPDPYQACERAEPGLPQGGGQIVVGRGMMSDMLHPPPAGPMSEAVLPVIDEIVQDEADDG